MCSCNQTTLSTCNTCGCTTTCAGCQYTLNTDCVIFNKERLDVEGGSVIDNSSRTLTTILQGLGGTTPLVSEFHEIADGDFTLDKDSHNSLIVLQDTQSSSGETAIVTLPVNSLDFAGRVYTFLNKTTAASGTWSFNVPLATNWDPFTTQTDYNTLCVATTGIVKLIFIQNTPTSWGWVILQN